MMRAPTLSHPPLPRPHREVLISEFAWLLRIAILLACAICLPLRGTEPLRLVYAEGGVPWAWQDNQGLHGILIEIADEALNRRMGLQITHNFLPWNRAQQYVKNGQMDALITNETKERSEYTRASREFVTNIPRVLYVRKDSPVIPKLARVTKLSQLSEVTLGSYIGNSWATTHLVGMNVVWAPDSELVLSMLQGGRFDVYIGNPLSTHQKLKELGIADVVMLPNRFMDPEPSQFKLLIRKDSEYIDWIPKFDKTIRAMRRDGFIDRVLRKYQ